jgi:hypothetical protein
MIHSGPDVRTASSQRVRAASCACPRNAQCLGTAHRAFVYPQTPLSTPRILCALITLFILIR